MKNNVVKNNAATMKINVVYLKLFCLVASWILSANGQSTSPPPAASSAASADHRLPYSVSVDRYSIYLRPFLAESDGAKRFTFDGIVEANLTVDSPADQIQLNARFLNISKVRVCHGACADTDQWKLEPEQERLVVPLNASTPAGTKLQLKVEYTGILNDHMTGFYRSRYTANGVEKYIGTTQMEATAAREAFPCLDEPDRKSVFSIKIRCDNQYTATSNMPIQTTVAEGNTSLIQFEDSVKMSTYLVAFMVHDFKSVTGPKANAKVPVHVYGPSSKLKDLSFAAKSAGKVLSFYEKFFKIPFPLPKLDMAAIPDFAMGAMENWGLITYRDSEISYNPNSMTNGTKLRVTIVIAHELAHQWFGNLVTMKWWDDLWLNEAFAELIEHFGVELILPGVPMATNFQKMETRIGLEIDALLSSHPVFQEVKTAKEIESLFDKISYQKGSSLLGMMRSFIGQDSFQNGLQKYLNKYRSSNAIGQNLWDQLAEQTKIDNRPTDVGRIMNRWTRKVGYPVVHVVRDQSRTGIKVTQSRFLLNTTHAGNTETWDIPLTLSTKSNPQRESAKAKIYWLSSNSTTISIPEVMESSDWFLVNVEQMGFFRVNYKPSNWRRLTRPKVLKKMPPANRVQMVDDAMYLARASLLSYKVALNVLTSILRVEDNYYVWSAANDAINFLRRRLSDPKQAENLRIFSRMMNQLGSEQFKSILRKNDNDWNTAQLRPLMYQIQCKVGNKLCLKSIKDLASQWLASKSSLSPNIRYPVLCAAIKAKSIPNLEKEVFEEYRADPNSGMASDLRKAVTCSEDEDFFKNASEQSLSDGIIRKQDARTVLGFVTAREAGKWLGWNFIRDNWDLVYKFLGFGSFGRLVNDFAVNFDDEKTLKEFETKMATVDLKGAALLPYRQALETVSLNHAWKKRHNGPPRGRLFDLLLQFEGSRVDKWASSRGTSNIRAQRYFDNGVLSLDAAVQA